MTRLRTKGERPGWAWLTRHPAHCLSFGLGSGLIYPAPGTWGTLAGVVLALPLYFGWLDYSLGWLIALATFGIGCWSATQTGRALGVSDHGSIVIDEVVAIWLVLLCVPAQWGWWLAAFVLFRVFDIVKPWPIRWLDARIKGGVGVMVDDVVAALFAIVLLQGAQYLLR